MFSCGMELKKPTKSRLRKMRCRWRLSANMLSLSYLRVSFPTWPGSKMVWLCTVEHVLQRQGDELEQGANAHVGVGDDDASCVPSLFAPHHDVPVGQGLVLMIFLHLLGIRVGRPWSASFLPAGGRCPCRTKCCRLLGYKCWGNTP